MGIFFEGLGGILRRGAILWILRILVIVAIIGAVVWLLLNLASADLARIQLLASSIGLGLLYIISDVLREIRDDNRRNQRRS